LAVAVLNRDGATPQVVAAQARFAAPQVAAVANPASSVGRVVIAGMTMNSDGGGEHTSGGNSLCGERARRFAMEAGRGDRLLQLVDLAAGELDEGWADGNEKLLGAFS
jgi:hypothetical protein